MDGGDADGYDRSYDTGGIFDSSREKWLTHSNPPQRPNQTWGQVALDDEVVISTDWPMTRPPTHGAPSRSSH